MTSSTHTLAFPEPALVVEQITTFIKKTYQKAGKSQAVIAVSGGIDSALSLTLLSKALGPHNVTTLFLPFADQTTHDAVEIARWAGILADKQLTINIEPLVTAAANVLGVTAQDTLRLGNIKARCRMIAVYDMAKRVDALVCGTENKSEHYLGYFTRFGDAASDVEPLSMLYKTQVRQLAAFLELPQTILTKAPSAELWSNQTDEQEMGFSYQAADQIMWHLFDQAGVDLHSKQIEPDWEGLRRTHVPGQEPAVVERVVDQVKAMRFKLLVPYSEV